MTTNNLSVTFLCLGCGHKHVVKFEGDRETKQSGLFGTLMNIYYSYRIRNALCEYTALSGCENAGKAVIDSKIYPSVERIPHLNTHITSESTDKEVTEFVEKTISKAKTIANNTTENGKFYYKTT